MKPGVRIILPNKTVLVLGLLILAILFFALLSPNNSFFANNTILMFLRLTPEIALMTIGMSILLIVGEFDLSLGSIYVFSSVILASLVKFYNLSLAIAILVALAAAVAMGLFNGIITVGTNIPSFITTLGMMWAYRGVMLILVGGYAIQMYPSANEEWIVKAFASELLGVPSQFYWLILVALVSFFFLYRTRMGNWIYSTGSNSSAARMMGIPTGKVKVICFAISGLLCGLAAVLQVSRMNHAIPQSGQEVIMIAIAGAVIGGTSLRGGRGNVLGALLGAFILQVISIGFIMLGFIEYVTNVVVALALISIAFSYQLLEKRAG